MLIRNAIAETPLTDVTYFQIILIFTVISMSTLISSKVFSRNFKRRFH